MKKVIFVLLIAITLPLHAAARLYVKPGAGSSLWDGKSPLYNDIESACSAASNDDSIWVAKGVYADGGNYINYRRMLYGGFEGTETKLSQRGDPESYRLKTIIDGENTAQGFRCMGRNVVDGFYFYRCRSSEGAAIQANEATWYTIKNCVFDSCVCPDWTTVGWGSAILFDVSASAGPDSVVNCVMFDCYSYCGCVEMRGACGENPNNTYLYVINCTLYNIHGFAIEWSKVESDEGEEDWLEPPGNNPYVYNCVVSKVDDRGEDCGMTGWTQFGDVKNCVFPKSHSEATIDASNFCTGYANNASCVDSIGSICFSDSANYNLRPRGNAIYFRSGKTGTFATYIGAFKPVIRRIILTE